MLRLTREIISGGMVIGSIADGISDEDMQAIRNDALLCAIWLRPGAMLDYSEEFIPGNQ